MSASNNNVFNNVVFNYVRIKNPEPKQKFSMGCDLKDCKYSVTVCVPAEAFKKIKKKFKTIVTIKNVKTYDADEYKETFKTEAPDPAVYANADDQYSLITFKAFTTYLDGSPLPDRRQMRVVGTVSKTRTANGEKIGLDVEVGNGSTGRISFVERDYPYEGVDYTIFDLTGIQVESLVVYIPKNTNENVFEFEEEDESEAFEYDEDVVDSTDSDTSKEEADVW